MSETAEELVEDTGDAESRPRGQALRALAAELWRLDARRMSVTLALSLAAAAFEASGVVLLVPLLTALGLPAPSGSAGAMGGAVRRALALVGLRPTLAPVLLLFVAVTALQAIVTRSQSLAAWRVDVEVTLYFRRRLYAAIAGARWLHFTRIRSSDLLTALTGECERCARAGTYLLTVLTLALISLAYFALALRVSVGASLVAGGCGAVLLLGLRGYNKRVRRQGQGLTQAHGEMTAAAAEHLQSMKTVKSYGAEARNEALFGAAARHAADVYIRATRLYADSRALFSLGSVALLGLVTWVSVAVLALPGTATLVLAFIFFRLVPRLQQLQQSHQMLLHDLPAYEHITQRIAALEAERERLTSGDPVHALADGIRFEGVTFAYPAAIREAVSGVTLAVPARRTTAIVGPSGSGKTTVADLVMGLVPPSAGRVVVDGRVLDEEWMRGWREGIGYVAQDTVLFHDTVRQNLRWASPDASDEALWEALRQAAADAFVRALPQGMETVIGERGVRLSGGERQRLALARALLRRPALLILDEATSALDTENERRIRDAIAALQGQVTILLITHRLSSVRDADAIHVMENGRLVESGTWSALMSLPRGRFRALWRSQEADDAPEPEASPVPHPDVALPT
ncbi:MAG: ABC transporter ATP-binding protein [Gemmatimonadetes bacterium]|nr:ABC transporter ATP-binding protein [Gemmatimonadota bacterium]